MKRGRTRRTKTDRRADRIIQELARLEYYKNECSSLRMQNSRLQTELMQTNARYQELERQLQIIQLVVSPIKFTMEAKVVRADPQEVGRGRETPEVKRPN
jgi:predicted RNase H-like nuclease (RuvC/YqgF family)